MCAENCLNGAVAAEQQWCKKMAEIVTSGSQDPVRLVCTIRKFPLKVQRVRTVSSSFSKNWRLISSDFLNGYSGESIADASFASRHDYFYGVSAHRY
jgi:hypothetical protein